jgi:hypothetical protein
MLNVVETIFVISLKGLISPSRRSTNVPGPKNSRLAPGPGAAEIEGLDKMAALVRRHYKKLYETRRAEPRVAGILAYKGREGLGPRRRVDVSR